MNYFQSGNLVVNLEGNPQAKPTLKRQASIFRSPSIALKERNSINDYNNSYNSNGKGRGLQRKGAAKFRHSASDMGSDLALALQSKSALPHM